MSASKRFMAVIAAILMIASVFCVYLPVSAHEDLIYDKDVGKGSKRVFDFAALLNDDDENNLQESIDKAKKKTSLDIVVVTIGDAHGKTSMDYADDFYDYNGFGTGNENDGILLLIDMDNRNIWISTTGKAINKFTDAKIDSILDDVQPLVKDGDYYDAAETFVKRVKKMGGGFAFEFSVLKTIIGMLIALATGGIYRARVKHQYKYNGVAETYNYRDKAQLNLTNKSDVLVDTVVVTERIESSSSSGGGGSSTHTSSSGSSHGGGGRSF